MSATEISSGFARILALVNDAAGEDISESVDVSAMEEQFLNGGSLIDWLLDNVELTERDFGSRLAERLRIPWEEDPYVDEGNADLLKSLCPSARSDQASCIADLSRF